MRQAGPVSDGPWMTWGAFGEVSLSVAPHADAGAALPLVALPPLLRDECSLTDRFNASLVDERSSVSSEGASVEPFLLRITSAAAHVQSAGNSGSKGPGKLGGPGSSSGGGGGGNDDDGVNVFDWPVSAGVGLLTPSLAPSRRPVASLSAESVWYNASAGQLGPVWLRAQALAVAAARAAQLPVLAFEASRTASLALTVANKSGWAAAVTLGDGGTGHAKELPGSGLDVTAEGLWAAALVTIPRVPAVLPHRQDDLLWLSVVVVADISLVAVGAIVCIVLGLRAVSRVRQRHKQRRMAVASGLAAEADFSESDGEEASRT